MNYTKPLKLLKNLPNKLNNFFNKNYKPSLKISNKSKNKKVFDPVTNLDKAFEKFIRNIIIKKFPKDAILGEEFLEKNSDFTENFIKLSRDVHFLNDKRAQIKLEINSHTGSKIREIKEYTNY
mgnify:CR=1 FL=1